MSINLHGLRTVVYTTTDLQAAKEWYSKAFGIEPYYDTDYYVGFNVGGYELGLHPADDAPQGSGWGGTCYWGVDDAQKAYDDLIAAGATVLQKPADVGEGIIIGAVTDPWGNAVGLIYNPHFKVG